MHNNTNYKCKICWNKALTFGVDSIQLSFRIYIPLCSPNTCKYVFNPNVITFQSNCAEGLHFSAFIIEGTKSVLTFFSPLTKQTCIIRGNSLDRRVNCVLYTAHYSAATGAVYVCAHGID